jgi:hypothetical protein
MSELGLSEEHKKAVLKTFKKYIEEFPEDKQLLYACMCDNITRQFKQEDTLVPMNDKEREEKIEHHIQKTKEIYQAAQFPKFVGVQPMVGPVAFAFALRYQEHSNYNVEPCVMSYAQLRKRFDKIRDLAMWKIEQMAKELDTDYENVFLTIYKDLIKDNLIMEKVKENGGEWITFYGESERKLKEEVEEKFEKREAVNVNIDMNDDSMPMTQFRLEKGVVEARSYKYDTAEELAASLDERVIEEISRLIYVNETTNSSKILEVKKSDIDTDLYQNMLMAMQRIAISTRRGPGTHAIVPESLYDKVDNMFATGCKLSIIPMSDDFMKDRIIIAYKGPTPYDCGIVVNPYVLYREHETLPIDIEETPLQKLVASDKPFEKEIRYSTRYGMLSNLYNSSSYFQMIHLV